MILHIISESDWQSAQEQGVVRAESLETEGFIHCSDPGTVHLPANVLFTGRSDLLLLQIDPARLGDSELKWEAGGPGDPLQQPWFPHVYGPIPVAAVVTTLPFGVDREGHFGPVSPHY